MSNKLKYYTYYKKWVSLKHLLWNNIPGEFFTYLLEKKALWKEGLCYMYNENWKIYKF